jgi:flagellar motor switch/type III secretory pathway protein FliN
MALSSLTIHWQDQLGISLSPILSEAEIADLRRTFFASDLLVCGSIEFTAPAPGRLIVAGRPQAFLHRAEIAQQPISRRAVENALGDIPVQVSVELGRASLTMREVSTLAPGSFIELSSTVDTPLPVRCEGILKAFGRPVVSNETVAVEIISVGGSNVD